MTITEAMAATWARVCLEEGLRPHSGVAYTYEYVSQEADHYKES
jgi:hypothetical protein